MSSTIPAIALGLGLAYYTLQTANEGKKEQKKQSEEMINRRVAVDTIEKERETKRDPAIVKFADDAPAKKTSFTGYYSNPRAMFEKMVGESGLPFSFDRAEDFITSGDKQEKQERKKETDAVATKMINPKNDLDDGLSARWSGKPPFELKKTDEEVRIEEDRQKRLVEDRKIWAEEKRIVEEANRMRKEEDERYISGFREANERLARELKEKAEAERESEGRARMATDKMKAEMFALSQYK